MQKKLSGDKVVVDLNSSVGLGRIDGNRLYGPGEGITVPVELAQALGKTGTPVKPAAAPQGGASSEGTGGGAGATTVKLQNGTSISVTATGKPSTGFPTAEGDINDKNVAELETELGVRGIELPDGKGSGASGGYVKDDLVRVLMATAD